MAENLALGLYVVLPCLIAAVIAALRRWVRRRVAVRWPHVVLVNFVVLLFFLSVAALGGEIYFRFIYDSTDSLLYTKVSQRWMKRYWHENQNELRDDAVYYRELLPGKRRVTFLGNSFTAGHGIKNVEDRFVNRLRRAHPEWDIHMLAKPGYDTAMEYVCLDYLMRHHWQIDLVVLVYGLNDISDLMPERSQGFRRLQKQIDQSGWLVKNSYLANTLVHRFYLLRNPFMRNFYDMVHDVYPGPLWTKQKERLLALKELVESNGGKLVVVTLPYMHDMGPNYAYQSVHDQLDQFWRESHVPQLDLLPLYRHYTARQLTVNRLDAHPNEFAHALATPVIEKFIEEQLSARPNATR
ncbi:MAG TPA: SGNH/GDSL hydrolase family protein [Verrucomicrobiae bacterium]|jgi:hypothetical protein|nr:SGNH/GDSL hydrolase family protein [Verrucomicrobiae bacterium]